VRERTGGREDGGVEQLKGKIRRGGGIELIV
jgi:hypothetical protein